MRLLLAPVRALSTSLLLYTAPTILGISAIAISVLAVFTQITAFGTIGIILGLSSLYRTLDLRNLSEYLGSKNRRQVTLNLRAPIQYAGFLSVTKPTSDLYLGDRPIGIPFSISIIIHNTGDEETNNIVLEIVAPNSFRIEGSSSHNRIDKLGCGEVMVRKSRITPLIETEKQNVIIVRLSWDGGSTKKSLRIRSCFKPSRHPTRSVTLKRWKHGYLAAFCWRADIDSFSNISNRTTIQPAFGYAGIFRVPPSLFLSSRLIFDYDEWSSWIKHFPEKFDGHPSREAFDDFLSYLRDINAKNDLEYPLIDEVWPCGQIGNHMYYHYYSRYGCDASSDTGWKSYISPGEYHHSWEGKESPEKTTLSEIRDNIANNNRILENFFQSTPSTWSAPADTPHILYPLALQKEGLTGSSEASLTRKTRIPPNMAPLRPDLGHSMPFHPEGTGIVETGAQIHRFDPHTVNQVICLKKTVIDALNTGTQTTVLIHPHLRLYSPHFGRLSSLPHFPEILRFLVDDQGSVLWITTHHSIVTYWEEVLCPDHRVVNYVIRGGEAFVSNSSDHELLDIPIELRFEGGKATIILLDLPPNSEIKVLDSSTQ